MDKLSFQGTNYQAEKMYQFPGRQVPAIKIKKLSSLEGRLKLCSKDIYMRLIQGWFKEEESV